jgi:hypothetical protein
MAGMKATTPKRRTDEVRLHTSTKTTGGKTYSQTCVRWYAAGIRKQKCFGQTSDAEAFRESILADRAKASRVPRGLRVVVVRLATGKRLLADKAGNASLQEAGGEPQPMELGAAVIAFEDVITGSGGHSFGPAVSDFLGAVVARLQGGAR